MSTYELNNYFFSFSNNQKINSIIKIIINKHNPIKSTGRTMSIKGDNIMGPETISFK